MENPRIALAMIIKPSDEEAALLDRCLGGVVSEEQIQPENRKIDISNTDGIAKHVDAIYLTITGENARCEEIAKKYGAIVSHFEWTKNFADARNFNFGQVPKEYDYIVWCDADDLWWHPEELRGLAAKMRLGAIDVCDLIYNYHYDAYGQLDVEHPKGRIVRNDGCVEWDHSALHEDFKNNRVMVRDTSFAVRVLHLTDLDRLDRALERNTDIAKVVFEKNPTDARAAWNLANCYLSENKFELAQPLYLSFLETSLSEEERFTAWHRLGQCYAGTGDWERGLQCELESLALRPWYPDAYFGLGKIYMHMGKYRAAREMIEAGFTKDLGVREKIAWNPRDYDYVPRMLLAEVYLKMYKPKESIKNLKKALKFYPDSPRIKEIIKQLQPEVKKFDIADKLYRDAQNIKSKEELQKLLDKVPEDLKYYPPIISLRNLNFQKTESSGKDVVIYCSITTHEWDPTSMENKSIGGSEEAVIQLSKRWAAMGWNVSVYANTGTEERVIDGVRWIPFAAWNYRDKQDVTILWRHAKALDYDINSDIVLIDMHDAVTKNEFTAARVARATKIMFKSEVQRNYYPNIPDEKVVVIPHGLDIEKFEERRKSVKKNPYKIINTSSADRGLQTSMEIIERVYDALPENLKPKLKFRWNYGFVVWDADFAKNEKMKEWKEVATKRMEKLKSLGIMEKESGDMIPQEKIVDQYLESGMLLYPSEFFEIGFISGTKAILAGAIPATTDVFAQGEFLREGIIVHSNIGYDNWKVDIEVGTDYGVKTEEQKQAFVDGIVNYLKNPEQYDAMRERLIAYAKENFSWDKTAQRWVNEWTKK